jgi:hypothetical protein
VRERPLDHAGLAVPALDDRLGRDAEADDGAGGARWASVDMLIACSAGVRVETGTMAVPIVMRSVRVAIAQASA